MGWPGLVPLPCTLFIYAALLCIPPHSTEPFFHTTKHVLAVKRQLWGFVHTIIYANLHPLFHSNYINYSLGLGLGLTKHGKQCMLKWGHVGDCTSSWELCLETQVGSCYSSQQGHKVQILIYNMNGIDKERFLAKHPLIWLPNFSFIVSWWTWLERAVFGPQKVVRPPLCIEGTLWLPSILALATHVPNSIYCRSSKDIVEAYGVQETYQGSCATERRIASACCRLFFLKMSITLLNTLLNSTKMIYFDLLRSSSHYLTRTNLEMSTKKGSNYMLTLNKEHHLLQSTKYDWDMNYANLNPPLYNF